MSKNKIIGYISIALIVVAVMLPTNLVIKVLIVAFVLGFDFFLNRALIYFVQGNRHFMNKKKVDLNKTWSYYRKAFNTGKLEPKYLVTMGNILAQKGDANFSLEVLDSVLNNDSANTDLKNQARVQKSMALERLDRIDESIEILQVARKEGYKEKSLYINLGCYLLLNDDIDEATIVLDESKDLEDTNAGSLDNRGWLYIAQEKWDKSAKIYNDMIERKPSFPDPYVHAAQTKLHYGKRLEAIELLKKSIDKKWSSASFFNPDIIKEMIDSLESEDNELYIAKFNASFIEIAKGHNLKEISDEEIKKLLPLSFDKEPEFVKKIDQEPTENKEDLSQSGDENFDNDDNFPNTELTDDDLKWEQLHNK